MELKANPTSSVEQKIDNDRNEEDDDALSLRDLQMYDQTSTHSSPRSAFSGQEMFEFFPTDPTAATLGHHNNYNNNNIMFFGKLINPHSSVDNDDDRYQSLRGGSSSFRLPERKPVEHAQLPLRSVSNRGLGSPRHGVKSSSVKKLNFTALTSKSRRRLFLFGPVPEMEMSSIRERQGRRGAPSQRMFPVAEGGGGGGAGKAVKNTVSCRARLNSVFARSVACLRN